MTIANGGFNLSSDNPYSSPLSPSDTGAAVSDAPPGLAAVARETFLAWEKLRLIYVGVLAALTLLMGGPALNSLGFWMMVAEGAIAANLCYFAGPIVETYLTWLGFRGTWLRWMLFLLGLTFSGILVVMTLVSYVFPGQA